MSAKKWVSSQHQSVGQLITSNALEKRLTGNTARSWWIALDTIKDPESCLKKLDRGVSRKCLNWVAQQKSEVSKLELRSQLGRTWKKFLLENFENEMRAPLSARANTFIRTECKLLFAWCLAGVSVEDLTSCIKMKLGDKGLHISPMITQYVAWTKLCKEERFHMFLEMDHCFLQG